MKEIAGGGTTTTTLCNSTLMLWRKDEDLRPCPLSLPFHIALPTMFSDERGSWVSAISSSPLPSSFFGSQQHGASAGLIELLPLPMITRRFLLVMHAHASV